MSRFFAYFRENLLVTAVPSTLTTTSTGYDCVIIRKHVHTPGSGAHEQHFGFDRRIVPGVGVDVDADPDNDVSVN